MKSKYNNLVHKQSCWKTDPYIEDLITDTEDLFMLLSDYDIDFIDFFNIYMRQLYKKRVDERDPVTVGLLPHEIISRGLTFDINKVKRGYIDPDMASWIGAFYMLLQYKTQILSKDLINIVKVENIVNNYGPLHGNYLPAVVNQIIKEYELPMTIDRYPVGIIM